MARDLEPYDRREFAGALAANAASKPFNVAVLVVVMAAGVVVGGAVVVSLIVALVLYAIACARTFFDEQEADRVLARERRGRARKAAPRSKLDLNRLAPAIRDHVLEARERERRIREAIGRAELPYEEVSDEVDGFVRAMEATAVRAQSLYEALSDTPPERVSARLREVEGDPARAELAEALRQQLRVQERMAQQLTRFYDEMERMLIELDTVRGSLVSLSATEGRSAQERLAGDVRGLRERMGAVSEGMAEAYEST
jgi:uncharacterized membrane protein